MMKCFFYMFILTTLNASAQTEDLDANQKGFSNLTQSGKLFQVEIRPADKHLHLYLTGLKAGELKVADTTIEASVGSGELKKTFIAEKTKDPNTGRYFYKLKKQGNKPLNLKIQSGTNSESFTFPPPN